MQLSARIDFTSRSDPEQHLHQPHVYLYLFMPLSDSSCFIHVIFITWLKIPLPHLFVLHFPTWRRITACSGEREQTLYRLPVLTGGSILELCC